jgi:hypothetical protein
MGPRLLGRLDDRLRLSVRNERLEHEDEPVRALSDRPKRQADPLQWR